MYKKVVSVLLSASLLAIGVASPRIIKSFDNLLEKFSYIVSADAPLVSVDNITNTYKNATFETELNFKTVSLTEKQAQNLRKNVTVEKDFLVKAETIDAEEFIEDLFGNEEDGSITSEGYPWNIPFVKGTEEDLGTLGSSDIKVGILDSGISMNAEFENVYRVDLVPDTVHDSLGIHYDVTGHGTNSAGIIAAAKNQDGIIGIAPNVSLYSIRVLDEDNEAPISRIIAGIEWAIENDIDVLNMSFGTLNYSSLLYQSIRRAYDSGMVLVASAGNTGEDGDQVTYPAKFGEVISVGSCDQNGNQSAFSPESADVDILAPGEYIECVSLVDGYCTEQGTSLSAPHVTAAAALILSADNTKTPEFVKQLLVSTANVSAAQKGVLDIKNALETLPQFEEVESITPSEIPENTEDIEEFEISEDVVVGSWKKRNHANLIYKFAYLDSEKEKNVYVDDLEIMLNDDDDTNEERMNDPNSLYNLCNTSKKNILLFARAAYVADVFYDFGKFERFAPLHAVGFTSDVNSDSRKKDDKGSMNSNYVADTKYLYRIARKYLESSTVSEGHSAVSQVPKANANVDILQAIVKGTQVFHTITNKTADTEDDIQVKGIVRMSIIKGYDESEPDNAAWKVLGLAAHLAADAYAHRTRVPISSTTKSDKVFYSTTAPNCFRGDDHEMTSGDNIGKRNDDETLLKKLLKEQSSHQSEYVDSDKIKLCQCYDCLRNAVSKGWVEFRDISEKYIYDDGLTYDDYDRDNINFYPQRYDVGTNHAVEKLITRFCNPDPDKNDFTIYVFLPPESTKYTLKLNGLEYYIENTGTNMPNLEDYTIDLSKNILQVLLYRR